MGSFDNATWSALGLVLTIVGLALSVLVWRRRGIASGTRVAAWSLLPLAAALTGTLRLLWDIADSVVSWAARLVFSPTVWLGVAVAGCSGVLFVVSAGLRRRGIGSRARGGGKSTRSSRRSAITSGEERRTAGSAGAQAGDDMADIEAILKKHGIS